MKTRQFEQINHSHPSMPLSIKEPTVSYEYVESPMSRHLAKLSTLILIHTIKTILIIGSYISARVIMEQGLEATGLYPIILSTAFMLAVGIMLYRKPRNGWGSGQDSNQRRSDSYVDANSHVDADAHTDSPVDVGNHVHTGNHARTDRLIIAALQVIAYNGLLAALVFGTAALVNR